MAARKNKLLKKELVYIKELRMRNNQLQKPAVCCSVNCVELKWLHCRGERKLYGSETI